MKMFIKKRKWLLLVFLLTACGIERAIPILKPPIPGNAAEASDTFIFFNAVEDDLNIDVFKGIEIYYKFYNTIEEVDADKNITTHSGVLASKFYRVNRAEDNERIERPLIVVPDAQKHTSSTYTIDFTSLNNVRVNNLPILRNVKDEYNAYKSFFNIKKTDADVLDIKDLSRVVYVVLYVFSYGIYDLSNQLYSDPVWLNKILLTLNIVE